MEFDEVIKNRVSIRKYQNKDVDANHINYILECGHAAPTAGNLQPWEFIIIRNQEELLEMPTYDYECNECGISFERFQNIKEEPIKKCPECGGNGMSNWGSCHYCKTHKQQTEQGE